MEKMQKSVRGAALLGAKYVVIHPIMPFTTDDLKIGKEAETWALNVQYMKALAAYAKPYGVTICVENMPFGHLSLARPDDIRRLIDAVGEDNVRMCLDTGHAHVFQDIVVADEVRKHHDVIRCVRIHDNDRTNDQHRYPYEGTIDWQAFGQAVQESGLDCVFLWETKPLPAGMPAAVCEKHMEALVAAAKHILKCS